MRRLAVAIVLVGVVAVAAGLLLTRKTHSDTTDDYIRYTTILSQIGQNPTREFQDCAALTDATLAGECAVAVAVTAASNQGGTASDWCGQISEEKWRSECMFQCAEQVARARGPDDASSLCQQAGLYQADCLMHLWQPALSRMVQGMSSAQFASVYGQADALYLRAAAQPGMPADLERRYWLSFFRSGFIATGVVEPARCATLGPEGQARCEAAAALLLTAQLEGALRSAGALPWFCGLAAPASADVAGYLNTIPSPALDQAVREQQPQLCGGGRPALSGGQLVR